MPDSSLTAYSYVTIAIFLLVVLLVIKPVTIRIKKIKLYFNLSTAPPLGVLILLICRAVDFDVVRKGFLGTLGIQPWSILILFYSLVRHKLKKMGEIHQFICRRTFVFHWT
jgi:hypothetical protein